MAIFGAPTALEDHAFRACLAALGIQAEAKRVAADIDRHDHVALQLRIGLNSGQVVTGEIGSGALGYTALGEQVGLAQRMQSVAPPGGVMLSESTSRLVESAAVLAEPAMNRIKGAAAAVPTRLLLATRTDHSRIGRHESPLVDRTWETSTLTGVLDQAIGGTGRVAILVGAPGIGKSRIVDETAKVAASRGVDVYTASCESHASDIPFHVVTRLLRAVFGISAVDPDAARAKVRAQLLVAHMEDLLLLEDLLGLPSSGLDLPDVAPDARRRRLTRLVTTAFMARSTPALYVVEDVHWIDAIGEAMLADFVSVIPKTRSMALITHRPGYRGHCAISRVLRASLSAH